MSSGPSRTARMIAAFRGMASVAHAKVCVDPFASRLAGDDGHADAEIYLRAHPHCVIYTATRTALLDDAVREGIRDGIDQVVLLGAGFDTRAARIGGARFFEVDRAESQSDKRARTAALGDYPADAATYVACDFERDDFLERLVAAGFDVSRPATFVWEGVVYYLAEAAARATLRRVAEGCHPRSRLFFDTIGKRFVRGDLKEANDIRAHDLVAEMGEPLRFGIDDPVPLAFETGFRFVRSTTLDAACLALTGTYVRERALRFQALHELRVEPPARP